ncbi:putative positive regulator of sigma-B [Sorangium cellulosum So ce56]|uniref:Positive regulator of sigma-B n=1 Tax=Sorangium cellulosum (strain So ce56) TaxID=448385 RepID=A9FYU6_SORC5|nr:STAS domain-containing protein [Sorangium cellulosum]CAN98680.1 putative positive regulator of sigma-B [Sorangium cellulosum So ce56]
MESASSVLLGELFARSPDLLFIASADGALLHGSGGLREALGPGVEGGARLADLAHPDDRAALSAAWSSLLQRDEPVSFSVRLRDGGGAYRPLSCSASRSSDRSAVLGSLRPAPAAAAATPMTEDELSTLRLKARILDGLAEHVDPLTIWALDGDGIYLYHDGKAVAKAGFTRGQHVGRSVYDLYAASPEAAAEMRKWYDGQVRRGRGEAHGADWDTWLIPLRSEPGGRVDGVLGVSLDVSDSRLVEKELRIQLDQIAAQQKVIRDLSTPIIEVWDGVLTLPMVGTVDSVRTAEVMDSLLAQIVEKRARFAILDLTGVEVVDTRVASHLIQLITAIRLLGADGIVAGIKPTVAQTMVALGLDLTQLNTQRNLRAALNYAIRAMTGAQGASPAAGPAPGKKPAP